MEKILNMDGKIVYDYAIEQVIEILESRINYYDCLFTLVQDDCMVEFEIAEELELMKKVIRRLQYNQEGGE